MHLTKSYLTLLPLLSCLHHLFQICGHDNHKQVEADESANGDEDGKVDGTSDFHGDLVIFCPAGGSQERRHFPGPLSRSFLIFKTRDYFPLLLAAEAAL